MLRVSKLQTVLLIDLRPTRKTKKGKQKEKEGNSWEIDLKGYMVSSFDTWADLIDLP